MVGKDILRFHTVYWPAFLMAAGLEPTKRVFAHGWWTNEGQKISKSLGNVIDPNEIVARYGLDQVRYFLMREVPFGKDGDFSHRAMINRINGELANDFGNLAQRVLSMIEKYCDSKLPAPNELSQKDQELINLARKLIVKVREKIVEYQAFHEALIVIWEFVRHSNAYVAEQEPWALRKNDIPRMETVLYIAYEAIRYLAIICQPFMPDSCHKMLNQLGIGIESRQFTNLRVDKNNFVGVALPSPVPIFPRLEQNE